MGGGRSFGANISLPLRSADYPRNQPARKEGPKANGNEMQEKERKKKSENRFLEKKNNLLFAFIKQTANVRECNSSDLLFAALRIFFFFVEDVDSRTVSRERSGAGAAMQMSSFGCSLPPPPGSLMATPALFKLPVVFMIAN